MLRRFVESEEKMLEERVAPNEEVLSQTILSHLQSNMEYMSSPISFHNDTNDDGQSVSMDSALVDDDNEGFEMDLMIDLSELQAVFEKTQLFTSDASDAVKATNNALQWDDLINYHQGVAHSELQRKDMTRIERIAEIESKLK